ncbi:2-amino-4-hydroxy-6-hydroxymethyldihydropteridine diphosphokinase [bacterium]|nr:2-amino-4-hydroxy-6-hydroxymethyldihydropteridine diphosphokinase [bacterium]
MSRGIFLGLGSNIDDRAGYLKDAIKLIGLPIVAMSSVYESEPVDYLNQPWFLNQVLQCETTFHPLKLLEECQRVEKELGRTREISKGPRIIDIDLLFYNDEILNTPDLIIPHPAIPQRRFVLVPMNEIAPDFVHPQLKLTIRELLERCPDRSGARAPGR